MRCSTQPEDRSDEWSPKSARNSSSPTGDAIDFLEPESAPPAPHRRCTSRCARTRHGRSASPPANCSMLSALSSRAKGLTGGVKSAYGTVHGPASRNRLWLGSKTGSSGFHGTEFPAQSSSDPTMESSDGSCDGRVLPSSGGGRGGCGGDFPDDIDEDTLGPPPRGAFMLYVTTGPPFGARDMPNVGWLRNPPGAQIGRSRPTRPGRGASNSCRRASSASQSI